MGSILARLIDIEFHRRLQHFTMVGAGRKAAIPPTLTCAEMSDGWHLQVMRANFATARKGIDASLLMRFEMLLVVESHVFFFMKLAHGRMAAIPLTLTSFGKKDQPDLCIRPAQSATTAGRSAVPSSVTKCDSLLVFKSHLVSFL
jgi:hypothetical protein